MVMQTITKLQRLHMLQTTNPELSAEIKLLQLMIENNELELNNLRASYFKLVNNMASVKNTLSNLKVKRTELLKKAHIIV
jgi:hypothetical protein